MATSRPYVARKYGPAVFEQFDHLGIGSVGSREIGKVLVDCKFRLSESQWGTLGDDERPAGIIFMDLDFKQPKDCRLATATVLVTLEYDTEPDHKSYIGSIRSNRLYVTEHFGPKELRGPEKIVALKKSFHFTPSVNVLGNGAGGVGVDREKIVNHTSRWIFSGNTTSEKAKGRRGVRGTAYKTMKWELQENDLEAQSVHNSVFHTAFTFEHEGKPFYLKVEINGKLQRKRDRFKHHMKFPPERMKDQGEALTLISLRDDLYTRRLDEVARGLPFAMQKQNAESTAVEMKDTLQASFHNVSEFPSNQTFENGIAPLSYLQSPPQQLAIEDQVVQDLMRALPAFCNAPPPQKIRPEVTTVVESGLRNKESTQPAERNLEQREFEDVNDDGELEVIEKAQAVSAKEMEDTLLRLYQYSPFIIMVLKQFANLLEIFGGKWPSNRRTTEVPGSDNTTNMEDTKVTEKAGPTGQPHNIEGVGGDRSRSGQPLVTETPWKRHENRFEKAPLRRDARRWR